MTKKNSLGLLQFIGSLLVLLGAALKFFTFDFSKYVFAGGTAVLLLVQVFFMVSSKNEDSKTQRFYRLMFLVTFLLVAAAYFMFTREGSWVPFVLAYAVVTLFLSFRNQ